jgi:signal transduction histidine kinase
MHFRHYVRARLHRRLFFWFGASILMTFVIFGAVMSLTGGRWWQQEVVRVRSFVGGRFAQVWDDAKARDALAASAARELDIDIVVTDPQRHVLAKFGQCEDRSLAAPVERDGRQLGWVFVCAERYRRYDWWRALLPLAIAGLVLWGFSGRIARRLGRPLYQLAVVAQKLGAGQLSARARLGRHQPGEVGQLADAINEMAARIEQQLADQRELLAAVSHELRTPLSRVRVLAELLRDAAARGAPGAPGSIDPKRLDDLDREVVEMDALVGELLASSRLDFAALAVQELDGADVARRALERAGAEAGMLALETAAGGTLKFRADPTLVSRALANLIDNARKHGGGLKTLRVASRAARVAFEAEDAGPGFPPGEEARVFEAFRRPPNGAGAENGVDARPPVSGLGLGLALVKRIAAAHGGTAYAQNRPEGGARVGIELPARGPAAAASPS